MNWAVNKSMGECKKNVFTSFLHYPIEMSVAAGHLKITHLLSINRKLLYTDSLYAY